MKHIKIFESFVNERLNESNVTLTTGIDFVKLATKKDEYAGKDDTPFIIYVTGTDDIKIGSVRKFGGSSYFTKYVLLESDSAKKIYNTKKVTIVEAEEKKEVLNAGKEITMEKFPDIMKEICSCLFGATGENEYYKAIASIEDVYKNQGTSSNVLLGQLVARIKEIPGTDKDTALFKGYRKAHPAA